MLQAVKENSNFYYLSNPVTDTIYVVNYYYECASDVLPVYINVGNVPANTPIAGNTNVVPLQNATYTYAVTLGNTIQWFVNGGTYTPYPDSVVVAWGTAGNGLIQVIETDANGCMGDTVILSVQINIINTIHNSGSNSISVYPNPATDALTVSINEKELNGLQLLIADPLGRVVKSSPLQNSENTIAIKDLKTGLYFLKIMHKDLLIYSQSFLKKD